MKLKNILAAAAALAALCACGDGEREYLDYRGLSMGMPASEMADSLVARGLWIDTVRGGADHVVLHNDEAHYMVAIYHLRDTITDILESYRASYNDSTSQLWQRMHDQFEKELNQLPLMTYRADLHKEAVYDSKRGTLVLTLKNNNQPTLTVRYSTSSKHLAK